MRNCALWFITTGICIALAAAARGGVFTTTTYTSDSDSGVTTTYTYTHAIDLGGDGATINSVTFVPDNSGNRTTYQYDVSPTLVGTAATDNLPAASGVRDLTTQYVYDSTGTGQLTVKLEGLTVGYTYTTTFYDIGSDSAGSQYTKVTDGDGVQYIYDENYNGDGNGTLLRDTFTVTPLTTTYTYTFLRDTVDSNPGDPNNGNPTTFFLYGFSNQVITPEPSTLTIFGIGLPIAFGYLRMRRRAAAASLR